MLRLRGGRARAARVCLNNAIIEAMIARMIRRSSSPRACAHIIIAIYCFEAITHACVCVCVILTDTHSIHYTQLVGSISIYTQVPRMIFPMSASRYAPADWPDGPCLYLTAGRATRQTHRSGIVHLSARHRIAPKSTPPSPMTEMTERRFLAMFTHAA